MDQFENKSTDNVVQIDDAILQQLQDDAASFIETSLTNNAAAEEASKSEVPTPKSSTPSAERPQQQQPQSQTSSKPAEMSNPPEEQDQQYIWEDGYDAGDFARNTAEGVLAAPSGAIDFAVDALNIVPGVDIPKVPKFKNDVAQSIREISSLILPNLLVAGKAVQGIRGIKAVQSSKLAQGALARWLGPAAISAGVGAGVDSINKINESDDNLQGSLKKMFPKHMSWISDDWATLDSDSADIKRAKNVYEGVGLGIFTDLLLGATKLLRAIKGTNKVTKFIPEAESPEKYWDSINRTDSATPEEEFVKGVQSQEQALDEIGTYFQSKQTDMEQPIRGVHDVFDVEEVGQRTADAAGVVGASVDAVVIKKNLNGSYGRLGSIVSSAALKYGLEADQLPKRAIVKAIVEQIQSASKYSAELASGRTVTFDEIDEAGTELASLLVDPRMDSSMLKATLDGFKDEYNKLGRKVQSLDDTGYNASMKAIKSYMDEYINMDMAKAQGYLTTSLAGQASDIAEGARLMEGTKAVKYAQEQILDRLEYLMVEKGLAAYNKGQSLNFLNTWKRLSGDSGGIKAAAELAKDQTDEAFSDIVGRAKRSVESMRGMAEERPEFLVPLQMAWEFSNGNVDTLSKLNNYVDQSLPNIQKAFFDAQPEIPNQLVQGAWSNIYNSVLTSISTPMKAGVGNAVLMLTKPISVFAGALGTGDLKTLKRGWYQYSAISDTFQKGLVHMGQVFSKASRDPNSVGYIMRDDLVVKNEQTMDILHSFGRAAERRGESGPLALYHMAETLHDISNNPALRFGANAMTALDGFTRAVIANGEARGRAFDRFIDGGQSLNSKSLKQMEDDIYKDMFDDSGMITDKAVDYASREIAMNLDSPSVKSLSAFIDRNKFLKPFLMFPRTSANLIGMANKHSPISLFMEDYNKLALPGDASQLFTGDQIKQILETKGITATGNFDIDMQAFQNLRAEIRGRKAIGTATIMGASWLFMNDRLHGNGHYDKERQRTRRELNWKPRSYKGWDGRWYSYDGLGPLGDFLAMTADVMDNFDSVTENDLETMMNKMGFLLSANLTNKSMLAGLEPMNDVLSGNPAAMNRWAASFASSLAPLSGFRNELGRLMAPQLRELDMEFTQLLRNRNKATDLLDPNSALPTAYDWIDGKPIGYADNLFVRGWNAVMPMKISDRISPERDFLIDIEYDSRPSFMSNGRGVRYSPQERSELYSLMGQQGNFRKAVARIMNTTEAKEWKRQIKAEREGGAKIDPALWKGLYRQLDRELINARKTAEIGLSNRDEVLARQYQQNVNAVKQQRGITPPFPLVNK